MKRHLVLLLIFCGISKTLSSQQLFAKTGITISHFEYENARGENLSNLLSVSKTHLGLGYRVNLDRENRFYLSAEALYNGYGAIGSDPVLDNFFEYDLNYLGAGGSLAFNFMRLREFEFFLNAGITAEWMLRGVQTLNNQVFDLKGQPEFQNFMLFYRVGPAIYYPLSRSAKLSFSYAYGRSLRLNAQADDEKLSIVTSQLSLGILINLPNCNCGF